MARIRAIRPALGLLAGVLASAPLPAADEPSTRSLDQRIDRLENIIDSGQIAELIQRIGELERELRDLRGQLEVQGNRIDELRKRQRNLYADLDRRIRELEVAGTQGSASGDGAGSSGTDAGVTGGATASDGDTGADGGRSGDAGQQQGQQQDGEQGAAAAGEQPGDGDGEAARKAYDEAFEMLKGGRYGESADAFAQFVEAYPGSPYADNAQYWLGESRYVRRDFEAALKAFRKVVSDYPESAKVPDARLKIGYALYEVGRLEEARSALQKVMQEHADSAVARLAEERLLKIKRETRQGD